MTLREALSILPEYTEDDDGSNYIEYPPRWWNWRKEWGGDRFRVIVGDQMAEMEHEGGEPAQLKFGIDVEIGCNTGQFDVEGHWVDRIWDTSNRRSYGDHDFQLIIGRWGIYIAVRGRQIKHG